MADAAPVFAVLIVALFGHQIDVPITEASWVAVENGIASTTFALALAAIWLGCSLAVAAAATGPLPWPAAPVGTAPLNLFGPPGKRVAVLVLLCAFGCVALGNRLLGEWTEGPNVPVISCGLDGPLIGMFLGLVVTVLAPMPAITAMVLLAIFIVMAMVGGRFWPLPRMSPAMRLVADAAATLGV